MRWHRYRTPSVYPKFGETSWSVAGLDAGKRRTTCPAFLLPRPPLWRAVAFGCAEAASRFTGPEGQQHVTSTEPLRAADAAHGCPTRPCWTDGEAGAGTAAEADGPSVRHRGVQALARSGDQPGSTRLRRLRCPRRQAIRRPYPRGPRRRRSLRRPQRAVPLRVVPWTKDVRRQAGASIGRHCSLGSGSAPADCRA